MNYEVKQIVKHMQVYAIYVGTYIAYTEYIFKSLSTLSSMYPYFIKNQIKAMYCHSASFGVSPNWNFWKYLVDEDGVVVNAWGPQTRVEDIFHEIKEAVDRIGFQKPQYRMSHSEL